MRTREEILKGQDKVLFDLRCKTDFKFFCEKMLGLTSMGGVHKFQLIWFDLAEANRNTVIEAPSGSAKTEIMGVCYPLWKLYTTSEKKLEILLVSKTIAQSDKNLLVRLKNYILDNEILKDALVPKDARVSWNQTGIRTATNSTVTNVPYNTNIKGYRAHLIICDEADSYEDVDIYFKHVTSRPHPGGKIILISTPEGTTNLIGQLKEKNPPSYAFHRTTVFLHKDGTKVTGDEVETEEDFIRLEKEGCYSIWPENEKFGFEIMREDFMANDRFSWIQNYLCEIMGVSEDTAFPLKAILDSYRNEERFSLEMNPRAMYFIGADFAISDGPRADWDAYVVIELLAGQYNLKYIEIHHGMPSPQKTICLTRLYKNFYSPMGTRIIADESNMGRIIIRDLRAAGCTTIPQKFAGVVRLQLIQTLSNVFQSGNINIPKNPANKNHNDLINTLQNQLLGFKRAKTEKGNETFLSKAPHDDMAISLAMAIQEATKQITVSVKPICR